MGGSFSKESGFVSTSIFSSTTELRVNSKMKPKATVNVQRTQKTNHVQAEGANWVLIAGGAVLFTLSVKIGCKLRQVFETKRSNNSRNSLRENGKCVAQRKPRSCKLHSNSYCYTPEEHSCYNCLSENLNGATEESKYAPATPTLKNGDRFLPLVQIPSPEPNKEPSGNSIVWSSSTDRLDLPRKPFNRSNCSDSPTSESGSDIYSKREVIQKLRQQLKKRDDMIIDMQGQIMDLQKSLSAQMSHSSHLQAQLDASNRDLFDSEREIQKLRKIIADHCMAGAVNGGGSNGYVEEYEGRGENEKVEMLKKEVGDLKEVIEGKEFLLQSYKEQKVELSEKVKELQMKLANQMPNILQC